jgi:hypothetical protein
LLLYFLERVRQERKPHGLAAISSVPAKAEISAPSKRCSGWRQYIYGSTFFDGVRCCIVVGADVRLRRREPIRLFQECGGLGGGTLTKRNLTTGNRTAEILKASGEVTKEQTATVQLTRQEPRRQSEQEQAGSGVKEKRGLQVPSR